MPQKRFISVILPLRLEWDPCYSLPEGMDVKVGSRVRVPFAGKDYVGVVAALDVVPETDESRIKPVLAAEDGLPPVFPEEIRLWQAVAGYYLCSTGEVYKAAYPALKLDREEAEARERERLESRLEALRDKLERARRDDTRDRYRAAIAVLEARLRGEETSAAPSSGFPGLTPAQETAAAKIRSAFSAGKTVLLNGVTGSGKTEIYLTLARETLREGRSVLYLVPEIALSRQLEDRIASLFPDVQVFHSGETAARRAHTAARVREESACLVLGTRSALFLPHHNLGLVIVDEEHDLSYKQDAPAPRYNGRETAIMLGVIQGAHVLLGSATPSLESLYNTSTGRFVKVDLLERYHSGGDAAIRMIDTVAERRKRGMTGSFSRKLIAEITETLGRGEQVLVLRARRSYAPAVQCTECGAIPRCRHCHVPLSLHRQPDRLVCHYCGHSEPFTGTCPTCGGALQPLGAGTQRVEEELRALFPGHCIERLDGDTPESVQASIIRRFARGEVDILVGTQIITKGFDFDRLSLVAVLQADSLMGQQDFRADERAFQLLEQFRGRSGRRGGNGRLVIQTREPQHPVYARLLGGQDGDLLEERRLFGYPPFTRLVHLILRDGNPKRLDYLSKELRNALLAAFSEADTPPAVVGPYAPAMDRIGDETVRQIRVSFPRNKALTALKRILSDTVLRFGKERKYAAHIAIDVDPS